MLNADERALLEQLLHEVGPRLYGYARKVFGTRVEPEDVVAETFARAAEKLSSLKRCDRKDLYLLAITRNLCRDAVRRRRPETLPQPTLDKQTSPAADPSDDLADRDRRRELSRAVARLSDLQREVVVLRMTAGLKFEEISELLAIPLGTTLSRMNAAIRKLRAELGTIHV